jgi:diguanylate cyclase (GGDEF)-like protein
VDRFKAINDRYGHPAGDDVLRQVAERLVEALAPGGTVGRLGGEEFGALFQTPFAPAERVCRRAIDLVAEPPMSVPGQPGLDVTVSAGLSRWLAGCRTREESLARTYEAADRALYEAKHAGRRRLVVHEGVAAA